ncbi:MAG: ComEC/Rec2 family competence protein [Phycisphaerae bacterium]
MNDHGPNPDRSATAAPARPVRTFPAPWPLLAPALALILGIWLSEQTGARGAGTRAALALATVALLACASGTAIAGQRRAAAHLPNPVRSAAPIRMPRSALSALLAVVALGVGYTRHQLSVALPPHHIAHHIDGDRALIRLAGEIASPPVLRAPERRNPYLPTDPSPRLSFILAIREIRNDAAERASGYIRVRVDEPDPRLELGDRVVVTGWLTSPRGPRNVGETDWARRDRLQHVFGTLVAERAALVEREPGSPAWYWQALAALRSRARSALFEVAVRDAPEETTSLLDALLLGQRSAVSRRLDEAFVRTGSVHILSVSGSHLGVVAVATLFLARTILRRSRRTAALATGLVIIVYAALAEPNPPILRSAVMGLLACAAAWVGRPFATRNWLGAAAIAILLYNPLELFQVGFQLSFVQVFALVTVVPAVFRWVNRIPADPTPEQHGRDAHTLAALLRRRAREVASAAAVVAVVAWLASLPSVLLHFGLFTPFGAMQSLLLAPLFSIAIVLGFATLVASAAAPVLGLAPVAQALGAALATFMGWLIHAVEALAAIPNTLVEVSPPPEWLVLTTYVLAGALLWRAERRREQARAASAERRHDLFAERAAQTASSADVAANALRAAVPARTLLRTPQRGRAVSVAAAAVVCGAWLLWIVTPFLFRDDRHTLHVLSVGSGSANVFVTPDRSSAIFDLGTLHNSDASALARAVLLREHVRRVALLAVSHDDIDHFSGVPALVQRIAVARLITNAHFFSAAQREPAAGALLRRLRERGLSLTPVSPDVSPLALDGARVRVLWPPAASAEPLSGNDSSLVLQIEVLGRRFLLPGDIERRPLSALVEQHARGAIDLRSDVLIAPHHGSISGSATAAFYQAVAPRVVVVSDRQARPRLDELVRSALGPAVRVLNTAQVGAVRLHVARDGALTVETPFAPAPTRPAAEPVATRAGAAE